MLLKGADGIFETIGGGLLAVFGPSGVSRTVTFLTQHELAEDPSDALAGWLVRHSWRIGADTIHFAAAYLAVHGLIKVFLVAGLLRERRWAFPTGLAFLGLFLAYQVYRLLHQFSMGLAFLSVFDLAVILLVWREYREFRPPS